MIDTEIIADLQKRIQGRLAGELPGENYPQLMRLAIEVGPGDILEIGTLYGGSAIAMALARKEQEIDGHVICLDPFEVYNKEQLSPDIVRRNAKCFGVDDEIEIIQAKSYPFPGALAKRQFVLVYIDGDHNEHMPLMDWASARKVSSRFVVFHDYDQQHPGVVTAVEIATADRDWYVYEKYDHTVVLAKVNHD